MDGGFKVPFIAKWPKRIQPGSQSAELVTNLDILPTLLELAGLEQPSDRVIDGISMVGLLTGTAPQSPRKEFFYYHYDELQAVRIDTWKYIRRTNRYVWPIPLDAEAISRKFGTKQLGSERAPLLYDLRRDPGERYNVVATHPDIAARLENAMAAWEAKNKGNPRGFAALAS
jgi:arylsulfatase A-like enzyme